MEEGPFWNVDNEQQNGEAWSTWRQPLMMLSLHLENGQRRFFAYAELMGGELRGDVLMLYFYHATVRLRGKGLGELADHIERQCVRCVREQHVSPFEAGNVAHYVERIEFGAPNLEALEAMRPR